MGKGDQQLEKQRKQQELQAQKAQDEFYEKQWLSSSGMINVEKTGGVNLANGEDAFLSNVHISANSEISKRKTLADKTKDASHHWAKTRRSSLRTSATQLENVSQLSYNLEKKLHDKKNPLTTEQRVGEYENLFQKTYEADVSYSEGIAKNQDEENKFRRQARIIQYKNLIHLYSDEMERESNTEKQRTTMASKLIETSLMYHKMIKEHTGKDYGDIEKDAGIELFGPALKTLSVVELKRRAKNNPWMLENSLDKEIMAAIMTSEKKLGLKISGGNAEAFIPLRKKVVTDVYNAAAQYRQERDKKIVNQDNPDNLSEEMVAKAKERQRLGLLEDENAEDDYRLNTEKQKEYKLNDMYRNHEEINRLMKDNMNGDIDVLTENHARQIKQGYDNIIFNLAPFLKTEFILKTVEEMYKADNISDYIMEHQITPEIYKNMGAGQKDNIDKLKKDANACQQLLRFVFKGEKLSKDIEPFVKGSAFGFVNSKDYAD